MSSIIKLSVGCLSLLSMTCYAATYPNEANPTNSNAAASANAPLAYVQPAPVPMPPERTRMAQNNAQAPNYANNSYNAPVETNRYAQTNTTQSSITTTQTLPADNAQANTPQQSNNMPATGTATLGAQGTQAGPMSQPATPSYAPANSLAQNSGPAANPNSTMNSAVNNSNMPNMTSQMNSNSQSAQLQDPASKTSYALGYQLGKNFKQQSISINSQFLSQGFQDGMNGKPSLMTDQEMQNTMIALQKELINKRQMEVNTLGEKNKKEGESFLEANKNKPGVKTTPTGLQMKILKEGNGPIPKDSDVVTVNYSGELINGKVFDSSYSRGKPVTFKLSQVIPGWQEALKQMPVGSSWEIYVPSQLGYGPTGLGDVIGPNSTLIFKIQLISIDKNKG